MKRWYYAQFYLHVCIKLGMFAEAWEQYRWINAGMPAARKETT